MNGDLEIYYLLILQQQQHSPSKPSLLLFEVGGTASFSFNQLLAFLLRSEPQDFGGGQIKALGKLIFHMHSCYY